MRSQTPDRRLGVRLFREITPPTLSRVRWQEAAVPSLGRFEVGFSSSELTLALHSELSEDAILLRSRTYITSTPNGTHVLGSSLRKKTKHALYIGLISSTKGGFTVRSGVVRKRLLNNLIVYALD